VARKKYDPLWEIIDEKVPLQEALPDVDAVCPHCNVRVHVGREAAEGRYSCGLCGGVFKVSHSGAGTTLVLARDEEY